MGLLYNVIKRPLITEKAVSEKEKFGRYAFEVDLAATKRSVFEAVESIFNVKVENVRTLIVRGKLRRVSRYTGKRPNWKKAIVTLVKGQKIEALEGK